MGTPVSKTGPSLELLAEALGWADLAAVYVARLQRARRSTTDASTPDTAWDAVFLEAAESKFFETFDKAIASRPWIAPGSSPSDVVRHHAYGLIDAPSMRRRAGSEWTERTGQDPIRKARLSTLQALADDVATACKTATVAAITAAESSGEQFAAELSNPRRHGVPEYTLLRWLANPMNQRPALQLQRSVLKGGSAALEAVAAKRVETSADLEIVPHPITRLGRLARVFAGAMPPNYEAMGRGRALDESTFWAHLGSPDTAPGALYLASSPAGAKVMGLVRAAVVAPEQCEPHGTGAEL